jgi:hypothetical protein
MWVLLCSVDLELGQYLATRAKFLEDHGARVIPGTGFVLAYVSFGETTMHWDRRTIKFGAVLILNKNDDASAIVIDTGPCNRNVAVDTSGGSTFMLFDNKNMPHGSIGGDDRVVFSACLDERLFENIETFTTWKSMLPCLAVAPAKKETAKTTKKKVVAKKKATRASAHLNAVSERPAKIRRFSAIPAV